ncbi:N-acetylmuramoyl-L-alanine amidase [Aminivibrio sp.]|uniref:N-acetylmuramoyl-L-alanine amidase family protein n=1 Tax=Aminivibrio sp. TaxID=1872489 RepID=UPI001A4B988F|nr:N-acetylmuramoyl-L-alanine amidase [Aminivibrio sp.]MBL3539022.1 N-acetylmuramoyl-L-alanine amidase [Aminivibrio sp.]
MRLRVLNLAAVFVAALVLSVLPAAGADVMDLYSGSSRTGQVAAEKRGSNIMVSARDMAGVLGLETSEKEDTLIVTAGRSKLQLVAGAAAAWLDAELVPLAASTVQEGKEWLVESRSALKLFNGLLVRSGKQGDLRWEGTPTAGTPSAPKSRAPAAPVPVAQPFPAGGPVISAIRWGSDEDKIRVVLDYEGPHAPEIQQDGGSVKVPFLLGKSGVPDLSSPHGEVKVSSVNFGDRVVLEFSSSLPLKEIIPLEGPPRIVIDYARAGTQASVKAPRPSKTPPPSKPAASPAPVLDPKRNSGPKIVVIDPGHGGKDPGAVANGIREKDVNLSVSLLLAQKLKKDGYDVRLTRDRDVYITLQQRTDLANKWNADVFVSIHANALPPGRHATGMEIYIMALPTDKDAMQLAIIENREIAEGSSGESAQAADKKTRMLLSILGDMQQNAKINESTGFAECLFKEGSGRGIKMRRVAQAPFFVLRGAAMPAVLIEAGFLTEKSEARMLGDKKYQEKMTASLAGGIAQYLVNN